MVFLKSYLCSKLNDIKFHFLPSGNLKLEPFYFISFPSHPIHFATAWLPIYFTEHLLVNGFKIPDVFLIILFSLVDSHKIQLRNDFQLQIIFAFYFPFHFFFFSHFFQQRFYDFYSAVLTEMK